MKKLYLAASLTVLMGLVGMTTHAGEPEKTHNLLKNAPYNNQKAGKKKLVNKKHLLMMQVALKPGQAVPQHIANSNVHIIIIDGEVIINLSGKDTTAKKGDLVPVAKKTPMNIKNKSQANATFIVIKTPNPN
jgi:quercetin dioxygenase-like cupin family protein